MVWWGYSALTLSLTSRAQPRRAKVPHLRRMWGCLTSRNCAHIRRQQGVAGLSHTAYLPASDCIAAAAWTSMPPGSRISRQRARVHYIYRFQRQWQRQGTHEKHREQENKRRNSTNASRSEDGALAPKAVVTARELSLAPLAPVLAPEAAAPAPVRLAPREYLVCMKVALSSKRAVAVGVERVGVVAGRQPVPVHTKRARQHLREVEGRLGRRRHVGPGTLKLCWKPPLLPL